MLFFRYSKTVTTDLNEVSRTIAAPIRNVLTGPKRRDIGT